MLVLLTYRIIQNYLPHSCTDHESDVDLWVKMLPRWRLHMGVLFLTSFLFQDVTSPNLLPLLASSKAAMAMAAMFPPAHLPILSSLPDLAFLYTVLGSLHTTKAFSSH